MNFTVNDKMLEFGELFLDELGLYADPNGLICDQDNDEAIIVNGKNLIYAGNEDVSINPKTEMLYDPLNNQTLCKQLFGFYADNRAEYPIDGFHSISDNTDKTKGCIAVESDGNIVVESSNYYMDSCKYADLVMRMNGDPNPDLSQFDAPRVVTPKNKKKNFKR